MSVKQAGGPSVPQLVQQAVQNDGTVSPQEAQGIVNAYRADRTQAGYDAMVRTMTRGQAPNAAAVRTLATAVSAGRPAAPPAPTQTFRGIGAPVTVKSGAVDFADHTRGPTASEMFRRGVAFVLQQPAPRLIDNPNAHKPVR